MLRRFRAASRLQRQAMGPAFAAGTLLGLSHYAHITARQLGAPVDTVIALSSAWTFCIVAVCGAFAYGLVRRRMRLAATLAALGVALRASDDRAEMRDALATALGDPTTELRFREPGSGAWRDARGCAVRPPPEPSADRAVTMVDTADGGQDVALIHHVALLDDDELLDGVSGAALANLRHERLTADLGLAMTDLDDSRRRIVEADLERARIARDLHDSAGHAISVIAVRAGAARLRHRQDPDRSLAALAAIEELARQTASEMDQLVGGLREGGSASGAVEAPPGLASLDALIAHHQAAGLQVAVDASGAPRPLGGAADQAAYRILQEALTNAARHGAGSARVEVAFGDASVELSVTNPMPPGGSPRSGGGHGLIGMRERATLLGGDLDDERANGTFRLRARIPYGGRRP
jgi:signal transduction histidine kinase